MKLIQGSDSKISYHGQASFSYHWMSSFPGIESSIECLVGHHSSRITISVSEETSNSFSQENLPIPVEICLFCLLASASTNECLQCLIYKDSNPPEHLNPEAHLTKKLWARAHDYGILWPCQPALHSMHFTLSRNLNILESSTESTEESPT